MNRARQICSLVGLGCSVAALLTPAPAHAQDDMDYDWRHESRRRESPQNWAFEIRFGPYRPRIDEEFEGKASPYERVFGTSSRLCFSMEVDYQALRIPYLGTIGPGLGWGYTSMGAQAKKQGTNTSSAEDTGMWIMPMYLAGVARFDVLPRELYIPVVPYLKLGMGYGIWKATNELGTSEHEGVAGKGHSIGWHLAAGGALQLDFLDMASAQQLDNSVGINHSYAFVEWVWSDLGGLSSSQMHIGTSSWVAGLAFEI